MTPAELKSARHALGLSARGMAAALSDPDDPDGHRVNPRTVRRWEKGEQDIPGPVIRCVYFMLDKR